MSRFISQSSHWHVAVLLTCLIAVIALGCAPVPTAIETDAVPAELAAPAAPPVPGTTAPLQLLVFHSPL